MKIGSLLPSLNTGRSRHTIAPVEPGSAIPRILHQTCPLKTDLPEALSANIARLKANNPGWDYRLYDDADARRFVSEAFGPGVLERFNRISPHYGAARADLFRYLLLYKVGGVYLDIKSGALRPLDEVLHPDDAYVLSGWRNRPGEHHGGFGTWQELDRVPGGEYQQWHVIAARGHPFLKAVIEAVLTNIDLYEPWAHGTGRRGVLRLTGPIAYTLAIAPIRHLHPHRQVSSEAEISFVYSVQDNNRRVHTSKNHYTGRTDSVITMTGLRGVSAAVYSAVKKLWRMYKERGYQAPLPVPGDRSEHPS